MQCSKCGCNLIRIPSVIPLPQPENPLCSYCKIDTLTAQVRSLTLVRNAAKELHDYLSENAGDTDDWPVDIKARGDDAAAEILRLLNNLNKALEGKQ